MRNKLLHRVKSEVVIIITLLVIISMGKLNGQIAAIDSTSYDPLKSRLNSLEASIPWLRERVNISVSDIPITEFIRAVANSTGANISIDPGINQVVVNNFSDVKVSDLIIFLRDQYSLDISIVGNIIVINSLPTVINPDVCNIVFSPKERLLSVEVIDIKLSEVVKRITIETGQNIVYELGLGQQKITSYLENLPLDIAIRELAESNNLQIVSKDGNILFLKSQPVVEQKSVDIKPKLTNNQPNKPGTGEAYKLSVKKLSQDSLWLYAENAPVEEIIKELSLQSGNNYIISTPLDEKVSMQVNGASFFEILSRILSGTKATFKSVGDIYLIGDNESPDLMKQKIIQMQYRTVDSILNVIPDDLLLSLETYIFREQNSIMLSGPSDKVDRIVEILKEIDKLVPVISIEVMIIDYNKSYTISTGIEAGITNEPIPQTSGSIFPSIDINLDSYSVNELITRFNGFGWAKLGKVTPNFYMSIQAMENQGILQIRSTPILSTLNGHKAELTIGNTEYYLEEQLNIIGTQNPQSQTIQTYKPIEAELSVVITPIVSGDDQITLEIEVTQSDFTERISTTSPPGKVQRTFKSKIRVKNEEMILLGGLEENRDSKTSSGVPILSKIPILKWFFSDRTEEKSKSKLNIFIKPTIIS